MSHRYNAGEFDHELIKHLENAAHAYVCREEQVDLTRP